MEITLNKERKRRILKTVKFPTWTNPENTLNIIIEVANYGFCPLKVGAGYQQFIDMMDDFHLDHMNKVGPKSIKIFSYGDSVLVLARTPAGIEGIYFDDGLSDIRPLTNRTLYTSIRDEGTLLLNNLEMGLYMNIQNKSNEELEELLL